MIYEFLDQLGVGAVLDLVADEGTPQGMCCQLRWKAELSAVFVKPAADLARLQAAPAVGHPQRRVLRQSEPPEPGGC